MSVTISHRPTGLVKNFAHPREAQAFVEKCIEKKLKEEDLEIVNTFGVALTAYQSRIPVPLQNLIERMELAYGGNIVPEWHFIWMSEGKRANNARKMRYSTGRTWTWRKTGKTQRIVISANENANDYVGVVIHEFAHALTVGDMHGRTFYRTLFVLLHKYASAECIKHSLTREFQYKKSSRYWYAEMYNIKHILAEYNGTEANIEKKLHDNEGLVAAALFNNED